MAERIFSEKEESGKEEIMKISDWFG